MGSERKYSMYGKLSVISGPSPATAISSGLSALYMSSTCCASVSPTAASAEAARDGRNFVASSAGSTLIGDFEPTSKSPFDHSVT